MTKLPSTPDQMPAFFIEAYAHMQSMFSAYLNASTAANMVVCKGMADITRDICNMLQETCNHTAESCKTVVASKTPQEAADKQAAFIKGCLDGLAIHGGKVTQASMRITKEAMEPLALHANDAMGAIMKKAVKVG